MIAVLGVLCAPVPAWAGNAEQLGGVFQLTASALAESGGSSRQQPLARITVSRAADNVGAATFFSRVRSAGSVGTVEVSSRKLPEGAIFSVPLRSPRVTDRPLDLAGGIPSVMPVAASAITSRFGMRLHPLLGIWREHSGIDLAAPLGTPVIAPSDGWVTEADWRGGYGLSIALSHSADVMTRYGHMSRLNVHAGQEVRKGDVIGFVGSTGESTGPHLHYEIRVKGTPVDPAGHLAGR